jgi:selenocysteine lyase/cysteine desulfurase
MLSPGRWFRKLLRPLYDAALAEVARFTGANPANMVFVQNATTAVNTVVKSLALGPEVSSISSSVSSHALHTRTPS